MSGEPSLIELVHRYQQAKTCEEREIAAEALVRRAEPDLRLALYGRCWESDVEDILQETWVAIFRRLDDFVGDADRQAWAWFYTILRSKLADYLRTRARNPAAPWSDPAVLMAIIEESAVEAPLSPQQRARLEKASEQLQTASPHCAEYFWLYYVTDLTYEAIGRIYGVSADAMRMRMKRCLKAADIQTHEED